MTIDGKEIGATMSAATTIAAMGAIARAAPPNATPATATCRSSEPARLCRPPRFSAATFGNLWVMLKHNTSS
jgi:hypothetical protein